MIRDYVRKSETIVRLYKPLTYPSCSLFDLSPSFAAVSLHFFLNPPFPGFKMLKCLGFFEKFCRPLMIPTEPSLEDVKNAILLKFPELQPADDLLVQVRIQTILCRKLLCM